MMTFIYLISIIILILIMIYTRIDTSIDPPEEVKNEKIKKILLEK